MPIVSEKIRASKKTIHVCIGYSHGDAIIGYSATTMHGEVIGFPYVGTNRGDNYYNGDRQLVIPVKNLTINSTKYSHIVKKSEGAFWLDIDTKRHIRDVEWSVEVFDEENFKRTKKFYRLTKNQRENRKLSDFMSTINRCIREILEE